MKFLEISSRQLVARSELGYQIDIPKVVKMLGVEKILRDPTQ